MHNGYEPPFQIGHGIGGNCTRYLFVANEALS